MTHMVADAMESVYGLSGPGGRLDTTYRYTVWGESMPTDDAGSVPNPYRWQGREVDEELVYFRYRYFAVSVFLSPDPVQARNAYRALDNNPTTRTDPYGLFTFYVHGSLAAYWSILVLFDEIYNWYTDIQYMGPRIETKLQVKHPGYRLVASMTDFKLPTSETWHDDRLGTIGYDRNCAKERIREYALIDLAHHQQVYPDFDTRRKEIFGTMVHEFWHLCQILSEPEPLETLDQAYSVNPSTFINALIKVYEGGAYATENFIIGKYFMP